MYKIVSIPGDGIGPEVVAGAVAVINQIAKKRRHCQHSNTIHHVHYGCRHTHVSRLG